MKKLPLLLLASTLTAMMTARAETVIFDDTFDTSSLNNATPADPSATNTAYQMLSGKSWSGQSIGTNQLRIGMVATGSGIMECQALFATNPVTLEAEYDSIQLRITFTNTAGLLSGTSQLGFGLYNSGGVNGSIKPVPGGLNGTLVNSQTGAATGNAQSWRGYFGQLFPSGGNHRIANRAAQTGSNNQNQGTATSGTSSGPANPAPANVSDNVASTLTLTVGATYTEVLTITKNGDNSLAITNALYSGPEPGGAALATVGGIATNATYLTNAFDSLSIAWRAATATTMDVSRITVTKLTKADLPALYNVQLNGWTASTFSGAAQIGSVGDLWNNPDWVGVPTGSTNLLTDVTLLDSTGADNGITLTMTSKFNNNTTGWNDSGATFQHYTGQTGGSATPVLVDQLAKIDYNAGLGGINVITLTFSGLPTNKLITAYVYGSGNGDGQGSKWSFAAANGGGVTTNVTRNAVNSTGRDVTLASSKGFGWNSISGTTDAPGKLTVTADGNAGGSVWWQIYMNGIQLQVGGTAPTIIGLTDQTVEDGTTVILSPVVTGNPTPTYQWYENGTNMPGEINPTLTLANVTTNQNGYVYSLVANNAISTASNSMTLTVNASVYSDMSVTAVSPANGATGICYDTPLTVTFSDTVTLGTIGSIKIFNAASPATPVDTLNAADGLVQQRYFPGDGQRFSYPTISISGNIVTINPHFNVLTPSQTYYVTIDPKTFKDSGGTNFVGLTNTSAWQFTTKSGPVDPNNPVVKADGSADFLTVQGAVNSIPSGASAAQRVIHIRNGDYNEIVNISGKHNVTFRGQDRTATRVGYANNATYQAANGGTTHARMAFKVNANDIVIENLTLTNRTAQGGSQAEALMLETGAARCIVNSVDMFSRQDTILGNTGSSQGYFYNSTVVGNFDYIWGGGTLYFDKCTIHTISGSSGFNVTAARTGTSGSSNAIAPWVNPNGTTYSSNGFSFVDCTFTADAGVSGITLAGNNGTAGGLDSWAFCKFDTAAYITPTVTLSNSYVFWQFSNTDVAGTSPVSFANVQTLGAAGDDLRLLTATNITAWFYGWTPQLAPGILTHPASQTVSAGSSASFSVSASGIPSPTYQWLKNGQPIANETNAVLSISSVGAGDAAVYSVEVANAVTTATSSGATLTITPNVQPSIGSFTAIGVSGSGEFSFEVSGDAGPNYGIQTTTNLVDWETVFTNLSPVTPFIWTNLNLGEPERFYRILVNP